MTALVLLDTFVIAILVLLVGSLLRAHGETSKAIEALNRSARPTESRLADGVPQPPDREEAPEAAQLRGPLVGGGYADLAFSSGGPNTVLGFLSSGCMTCHGFWAAFQPDVRTALPGDARLVLVTNDSSRESPSKLAKLAPDDVPVVMSTDAWEAYDVPAAPYFVYIDGPSGKIHGEGSALEWPQVESLLNDALFDAEMSRAEQVDEAEGPALNSPPPQSPVANGAQHLGESNLQRNLRADAALEAAGIPPDDPSFWDLPRPSAPSEEAQP